ncbi:FAD-dependent oxidoreductase [Leptolyngbya sp. AN02str]|uniref:FAD-dependent oxidoreductase n=1 Tax=Leptolyngbya sp. AN02str TaxID=3423363 RepID=UPI003D31257F
MFDYDLLVIGAGSGGLAAAERAATYGARVAIAERSKPGGACVNYGCIPEKLLDYAASFNRLERVATSYGWQECRREFDWSRFVSAEVQHIQHLNELHRQHLQDAGVQLIHGHAHFLDAHTVQIDQHSVTAERMLIAVGAKPSKPDIPGIEHTMTWHELYYLPEQPKTVAVIGGDPIGVKIAGSLKALGSEVTQVIAEERLLSELDAELSLQIQERLLKMGVQILPKATVSQIEKDGSELCLTLSKSAESKSAESKSAESKSAKSGSEESRSVKSLKLDSVLVDATRQPNLSGLNLKSVGVQRTELGAIWVDERSCTTQPHIFAIGDCTERIPLTPSAIAQGRIFSDTEFGGKPRTVQLDWVPMSLSSHPEAATVGMSETQARETFGDAVVCYRTQFQPLLYCLTGWNEKTFMKVIVNQQDSERVLGIHVVGDGAVDMIQSLAVALKLGLTKPDLDTAIGIHPSSAEELFSI